MGEDGLDGEGVLDGGDNAQPAATAGTSEDIEREHAVHQRWPGPGARGDGSVGAGLEGVAVRGRAAVADDLRAPARTLRGRLLGAGLPRRPSRGSSCRGPFASDRSPIRTDESLGNFEVGSGRPKNTCKPISWRLGAEFRAEQNFVAMCHEITCSSLPYSPRSRIDLSTLRESTRTAAVSEGDDNRTEEESQKDHESRSVYFRRI